MTTSEMPHHAGIGMLQQFPHVPVLHFKACFLSGNIPNGRNTVISVYRGGKKKKNICLISHWLNWCAGTSQSKHTKQSILDP